MLRRDFLGAMTALGLAGPRLSEAAVQGVLPPEGVRFDYGVFYGGHEVGEQRVLIRSHDREDHVVIEHAIDIEVRILFAVVYALEHRSTEVWNGFQLASVVADTRQNDEASRVEGEWTPAGFALTGTPGAGLLEGQIVTADSFWIAAAMKAPRVLNTRTGDVAAPRVRRLEDGRWHLRADFAHGPIDVKLRFDGEFLEQADLDDDGHTVQFIRKPV